MMAAWSGDTTRKLKLGISCLMMHWMSDLTRGKKDFTFECTEGGTLLWMASKFAALGGRDPLRTLTSRTMMDVRAVMRTWFFAATVADSKSWRLKDTGPGVGVCGFLSFLGLDLLKRMVA
jgi:hypothetical protein